MTAMIGAAPACDFDAIDRQLLGEYQRAFPLTARPYAALADRLGVTENEVMERLARLKTAGAISRIGAVVRPHAAGASTLAAMQVPVERLDGVAAMVSAYPEINHNYEREHRLNLWFVVAAPTGARVQAVLADIAARTGIEVLDLPLVEDFHIDLGFGLQWT